MKRATKIIAASAAAALAVGGIAVAHAATTSTASCTPSPVITNTTTGQKITVVCTVPKPPAVTKTVTVPGPTVTVTATPTPTPSETATPTQAPSETVTPEPTQTPTATQTPTDPPPATTGKVFPRTVWLQDPAGGDAEIYKSMGVTTFLGLWEWPSDSGKWAGWAQDSLDKLTALGMDSYAGEDAAAIQKTLTMKNNAALTGWLAGDEPDMFGPDVATWQKRIADMKAVDNRPVAGNFGLGFGGFDWWYDHLSDADRAGWCKPIDVPSVDYYGMTSPEPANHLGAWTYGRAIDNLRKACGDAKPLGSFIETSEMADTASTMTAAGIKAAAWNAIIHGADSINWFVHDFKCNPECGPSVFLRESKWAANRDAMTQVDNQIAKYQAVLLTPDVTGASAATVTGIKLHTLTKRLDGVTYVFAQSAGDTTKPGGLSGEATVTVDGKTFTDTWTPNQVRVYTSTGETGSL